MEEPKKKSRADWRIKYQLEDVRIPRTAAVDERGRDIDPHIPQYISEVPRYFGCSAPTLKHQRARAEKRKTFSDAPYSRGQKAVYVADTFDENCGSMTHKRRDCVEIPGHFGPRYPGADHILLTPEDARLNFDYDGKGDRRNGYDPKERFNIIQPYPRIKESKHQLKAAKALIAADAPWLYQLPQECSEETTDEYSDDAT